MVAELENLGLPADAAQNIAQWDPYDQNASANWFDSEYMFSCPDGFDVVIGNPPYVESRNSLLSEKLKDLYANQVLYDWEEVLPRGSDLLIYFYARSPKLLKDSGHGCLITQNAWLNTDYGKKFQEFSLGKFSFQKIIDTSAKFFADTGSQNINTVITTFTKKQSPTIDYLIVDRDMANISKRKIEARQKMKWGHLFAMSPFYADIFSDISAKSRVGNMIKFGQGLNFPQNRLDEYGANIPVVFKDARFVAEVASNFLSEELISESRRRKIPALIMPRGVGDRHYCTFNLCNAFSYSHVEVYLPYDLWESDFHYCLWAYLNSSFIWLYREITGRKNLGGGLLKAEATDMKSLPVNFDFDFAGDARKVFNRIKNREPLPVSEEVCTEEHVMIDEIVADYLGFRKLEEKIKNELVEHVSFRLDRAQ